MGNLSPKPNEVIEKYYRARAQNRRITLKQVCADMGANYASIRATKVAYDKRRKSRPALKATDIL